MKNKKKKKGEITARDTRGVQFELNQVTKLYDFASEEKVHRRQASRMKLKSTGLDRFDADGTPRRNAMQHLGSVGNKVNSNFTIMIITTMVICIIITMMQTIIYTRTMMMMMILLEKRYPSNWRTLKPSHHLP